MIIATADRARMQSPPPAAAWWSPPCFAALGNAVLFVIAIACNASAGSRNKTISDAHPTAFTPAGYAFSIWGLIYSAGAAFIVFQCASRSRWSWVYERCGPWFAINFVGNSLWIFAFTNEWGQLWVSTAIIFVLVLGPLIVLYRRIGGCGLRSDATAAEFFLCHFFVSIYLGWVCVACIANVSLSLTPSGGPAPAELAGASASVWSIIMQTVAAALALVFIAVYKDCVFAAPISWALFAIAKQQEAETWPGGADARVVTSARALGSIVAIAALGIFALRLYWWIWARSTHFAPSSASRCWESALLNIGGVAPSSAKIENAYVTLNPHIAAIGAASPDA